MKRHDEGKGIGNGTEINNINGKFGLIFTVTEKFWFNMDVSSLIVRVYLILQGNVSRVLWIEINMYGNE